MTEKQLMIMSNFAGRRSEVLDNKHFFRSVLDSAGWINRKSGIIEFFKQTLKVVEYY